jgi:hypothetical protein
MRYKLTAAVVGELFANEPDLAALHFRRHVPLSRWIDLGAIDGARGPLGRTVRALQGEVLHDGVSKRGEFNAPA